MFFYQMCNYREVLWFLPLISNSLHLKFRHFHRKTYSHYKREVLHIQYFHWLLHLHLKFQSFHRTILIRQLSLIPFQLQHLIVYYKQKLLPSVLLYLPRQFGSNPPFHSIRHQFLLHLSYHSLLLYFLQGYEFCLRSRVLLFQFLLRLNNQSISGIVRLLPGSYRPKSQWYQFYRLHFLCHLPRKK